MAFMQESIIIEGKAWLYLPDDERFDDAGLEEGGETDVVLLLLPDGLLDESHLPGQKAPVPLAVEPLQRPEALLVPALGVVPEGGLGGQDHPGHEGNHHHLMKFNMKLQSCRGWM